MALNDRNPDFKVMPLFDVEYLRNVMKYRRLQWNTKSDLHVPYSRASFQMTLSDLVLCEVSYLCCFVYSVRLFLIILTWRVWMSLPMQSYCLARLDCEMIFVSTACRSTVICHGRIARNCSCSEEPSTFPPRTYRPGHSPARTTSLPT